MKKNIFSRRRGPSAAAKAGYIAAIAAIAAADQLVKLLIVTRFSGADIPLIGDFMHICYVPNTGAAFSILEGKTAALAIVTAVMIAVCVALLIMGRVKGALGRAALVLISGGGAGNLIDRVFRGYVVDFLYPKFINFAIFNLADCCVVIGAALLCIYLIADEAGQHKAW
jgi:signal peptidase II